MGIGSWGGTNMAANVILMSGRRGGFGGGGYGSEDKEPKKFSWLWFSINALLIIVSLSCIICMTCLDSTYTRVGKLYVKNQSEHQHKGNYYPEYYFTVKWNDREKEIETFEVAGETFFSCNKGENVYFKRIKPEYEWTHSGWLFLGFVLFGIAWLVSGIAALLKNE